jgi:hypothetical protein
MRDEVENQRRETEREETPTPACLISATDRFIHRRPTPPADQPPDWFTTADYAVAKPGDGSTSHGGTVAAASAVATSSVMDLSSTSTAQTFALVAHRKRDRKTEESGIGFR